MPMMASSTSTPQCHGKPAERHRIQREPHAIEDADRASNDSGMAVNAIKAARKSRRNNTAPRE